MATNGTCTKRIYLGSQEEVAYICAKAEQYQLPPSAMLQRIVRQLRLLENQSPADFATALPQHKKETTQRVVMRLTTSELQSLQLFATKNHLSRQQALILLLRHGLTAEPFLCADERKAVTAVAYEIHKLGVNVNQLAHTYNELWKAGKRGQMDPHALAESVRESLKELKSPMYRLRSLLALKNRQHPLALVSELSAGEK